MGYRVGIDVGGTFTDFLLVRSDGSFATYKTFTTPQDQSVGIMQGFSSSPRTKAAARDWPSLLANVDLILHGTTATTNSVLTGSGARTGLLTTQGFRDALEMRRGVKERIYDNKYPAPPPLIPRYRRLAVAERLDYNGAVVEQLNEDSVAGACDVLRADEVSAVAICFLNAYGNGVNEAACKRLVERHLDGVYITASHELLPRVGFYDRLSTTVLNSYTGPILARYLSVTDPSVEPVRLWRGAAHHAVVRRSCFGRDGHTNPGGVPCILVPRAAQSQESATPACMGFARPSRSTWAARVSMWRVSWTDARPPFRSPISTAIGSRCRWWMWYRSVRVAGAWRV